MLPIKNLIQGLTILALTMLAPTIIYSQSLSDVKQLRDAKKSRATLTAEKEPENGNSDQFLKFYLPSSILFSGIEPAAVSKINLGFGDDKIEVKFGTILGTEKKEDIQTSWFLKVSAEAPDGARTIFQYDKTPMDFDGTIGFTWLTKHEILKSEKTKTQLSRRAQWVNINLTVGNSKKILFQDEVEYTEKNYTNFTLMGNYNWFYNEFHDIPKKWRKILSVGLGMGTFDNYADLDSYTLRKGVINNGGQYIGETESVSGKMGEIDRMFGLMLNGAGFIPISKFDAKTYVMLGANLNSFGLGTDDHYLNGNFGCYISKRGYDDEEEQLKEDFSFGILADFSDLDYVSSKDYLKDNFRVIITAQIPLRFWE